MYVKCVCVCVCVCEYMYVYVCEMCVYVYECWSLEALKLPYSPDANWKESPCGLSPKEFICKAVSRPYFAIVPSTKVLFQHKMVQELSSRLLILDDTGVNYDLFTSKEVKM